VPPTVHPPTVAEPAATPTPPPGLADILSAFEPGGAIAEYGTAARAPGPVPVEPYFANYADAGLAAWLAVHPDPPVAADGWAWLAWYAHHMQRPSGYIDDYTAVGSDDTPTGSYDSTDAYAGTFLVAVNAMDYATGNLTEALRFRWPARLAMRAIASTMQPDGLTYAKPDYPAAYTLDNSEVEAGLAAADTFAARIQDWPLRNMAAGLLRRADHAIATLWNPAADSYDWAAGSPSELTANDAYPDGWAQIWPVGWNIPMPPWRARRLPVQYANVYPTGSGTAPMEGWAALRAGNVPLAQAVDNTLSADLYHTLRTSTLWTVASDGELLALQAGLAEHSTVTAALGIR